MARAGRLLGAIAAAAGALLLAACGGPAPQVQQTERAPTGGPGAAHAVVWGQCAPLGNDARGAFLQAVGNVEAGRVPGTTPSGRAWEPAAVAQLVEGAAEDDASSQWFFPDRIVCSDFDLRVSSAEGMRALLAQTTAVAPDVQVSAESAGYLATCATGPGPSQGAGAPFAPTTDRSVLLVSNRLDPSTPREWADQVAARLGAKAQHIVTDLIGHGGALGEPDVLAAVTAYVDAATG